MQKKANVFEEIERPWCSGALVHFLLMLGFMRVDAFQNTQSPEYKRDLKIIVNEQNVKQLNYYYYIQQMALQFHNDACKLHGEVT